MKQKIVMPTLSDTMTTGRLVRWVMAPGDAIKSGDTVAEVETDKAVMDVEAFHDGYLAGPLAPIETDLPVGQAIGYIADQPGEISPPAAPDAEPVAKPDTTPEPEARVSKPAVARPKVATATVRPTAAAAVVVPVAFGAEVAAPETAVAATSAPCDALAASRRPDSSPLARRLAKEAGVALSDLHGTGPQGRIVAADVTQATSDPASDDSAATFNRMTDSRIRAMYPDDSATLVPHSSMRRMIAQRLVQASIGTPHFDLTVDCDIGKLLDARHALNATAPMGADGAATWTVSITDCIVKAMALALQRVPEANATWTEGGMLMHARSDIGVAVSIKDGLIAPLIRSADTKSLAEIATELLDLAARARSRKLVATDYEGGSSTVSNLGMDGIRNFSAVLNPPQATILAVGAGEKRAVVRQSQIVAASMMTVTLTCDHRVVDGAAGARLLGAFKASIEAPETFVA